MRATRHISAEEAREEDLHHDESQSSQLPPFLKSLLTFGIFFVAALLACTFSTRTNPTSAFFDTRAAHADYSRVRQREAHEFIHRAYTTPQTKAALLDPPGLCVVVNQSARPGNHSFATTVGSLLHGLSDFERELIHLMVSVTSDTEEPWLDNAVDSTINHAGAMGDLVEVMELEVASELKTQRAQFNYADLLHACSYTFAKYVLVLDDDMIAMDGWIHRTLAAISVARSQKINHPHERVEDDSLRKRSTETEEDFLYLRLFHSDSHLKWDLSSFSSCLPYVVIILAVETLLLLLIRLVSLRYRKGGEIQLASSTEKSDSASTRPSYLSYRMILVYTLLYTPFFIALFFAAGKPAAMSLAPGIHQLPTPITATTGYGLLFPAESATVITRSLASRQFGSVEETLAAYAAQHYNQALWTLTPCVLDRVTPKSKSGRCSGRAYENRMRQEGSRTIAGRKWLLAKSLEDSTRNFFFETMKREVLEAEHLAALN